MDDLLLEREVGARARGPAWNRPPSTPGPRCPTTCSAGTKTSVRKTSLNSASPVIWTSGPHVDPGVGHVDDQRGDALLRARRIRLGAGQAQAPGGELRVRSPDLATGDRVATVDRRGTGRQRRQVAAGVGLAEELAPDLLGREDRRQVPQALVLGAVRQQRGADQVDPDPVDRLRSLRTGVLALVERDLHRRRPPTAVGLGPVHTDPAVGRQRGLPPRPQATSSARSTNAGGRCGWASSQSRNEAANASSSRLSERSTSAPSPALTSASR